MQFTGCPGPLPRDVLITFPHWSPWVTRLEMSKGRLQLTLLCSAWENQRSSAPRLALVQGCGIFQENFKIITERGRHLKTDLEEEKEEAGQLPQVCLEQSAGNVVISHTETPGQHPNLTWGPPGHHHLLLGVKALGPTGPMASAKSSILEGVPGYPTSQMSGPGVPNP